MKVDILLIVQIMSIVGAAFGFVAALVIIIDIEIRYFALFVITIFIMCCCLALLLVEIYVFSCFRYFGFLIKPWGKALTFGLMGFLFFAEKDTFRIVTASIFWALSIIYIIISIFIHSAAPPLAQRGKVIELATSTSNYYKA